MNAFETIMCAIDGPIATVTLNRPEARNAMNNRMVSELLHCFTELGGPSYHAVRAVEMRAAGDVFCAGGDLRDLSSTISQVERRDSLSDLDKLLHTINEAPQVVVACVQGSALGGGLGLVCVSDIAVAAESASFGFTEARLGLAPSLISPYVIAR